MNTTAKRLGDQLSRGDHERPLTLPANTGGTTRPEAP